MGGQGGGRRARTLLSGDQIDLAAFLVQQALEKALKALLVAAAQDVRRTHDIDALATLARAHWPQLLASPFPLAVAAADSGRGCRSTGGRCRLRRRRSAAFPARSCGQRRKGGGAEAMSDGVVSAARRERGAELESNRRIERGSLPRHLRPKDDAAGEGRCSISRLAGRRSNAATRAPTASFSMASRPPASIAARAAPRACRCARTRCSSRRPRRRRRPACGPASVAAPTTARPTPATSPRSKRRAR